MGGVCRETKEEITAQFDLRQKQRLDEEKAKQPSDYHFTETAVRLKRMIDKNVLKLETLKGLGKEVEADKVSQAQL